MKSNLAVKSKAEIHAEVVRQAQRLARDRFDEIQRHIQQNWPLDIGWPFHGGDYPWLCELAKRAIDAGMIPGVRTNSEERQRWPIPKPF